MDAKIGKDQEKHHIRPFSTLHRREGAVAYLYSLCVCVGLNFSKQRANRILRAFASATRATVKTLTQAGHVAPKVWVLDIRT